MRKILISFLFFIYSSIILAESITIASYNTLHLGTVEKDYTSQAKVISKFDIIALQEVMNYDGLNRLKNEIEKISNKKWGYVISSKPLGTKDYKEYYAFIYQKDKINKIESLGIYKDGKSKEFIRSPFAVYVKSNKFDFVLITAHSIFGDNKSYREEEASRYHKVYKYFLDKSKEEDVILLGDFNIPSTNNSFNYLKNKYDVKEVINSNKFKTTIGKNGLANSYDNIFFNRKYLKEYTGRYGVYDYTKNNYKEIRKYVSDHLLIFAEFENKGDLDGKK